MFHGCGNEKRQSKNFQSRPSFQTPQPVLILAGEKLPVGFSEKRKCGSGLGAPTPGLPRVVGLMGSVSQESRNSVWINAEEIISSSRGYDKIVNRLKKIKPYSLAQPFGPAASRESMRKKQMLILVEPSTLGWTQNAGSSILRPVAAEKEKHSPIKTWSTVKLLK